MTNYYDVYTTLTLNPETEKSVNTICNFLKCRNQMEELEKALWNKQSRIENPGAFPFDEETGKIYDVLWKAAQSENYSTLTRIGRWIVKTICPPANDEGMAAFHRKAHDVEEDEYEKNPPKSHSYEPPPPTIPQSQTYSEPITHYHQEEEAIQEPDIHTYEDEPEDNTIIIDHRKSNEEDGVIKRGHKKSL